ncbi:MAG: DUF2752 domain-containing protein [Muribaculaceae bacterium]|nr:DUF2752 domain-containing protein [Muribaculaceae bacterium]
MEHRKQRLVIAAICLAAVAAVLYYGLHDPAAGRSPRCVLRLITGYDCPGCGSQRALHALLHGRLGEAWHYNPALFVLLPLAAAYGAHELSVCRNPRLERILYNRIVLGALCAGILLWWVLRNL